MSHNHDVASSHCPSQDWDKYCDSQEIPEQCPECGGENANEEGEPLDPKHPAFCSVQCADVYTERQFQEGKDAAAEFEAEQKMLAEHNDKCPTCKGSTQKYCFHPSNPDNKEE